MTKEQEFRKKIEEAKLEAFTVMCEKVVELEEKISILLSCKKCPENKGGLICVKEYENKCLAQKIQYIKELQQENEELKAGRPKWHKLDWEKDYPKSDRLVRVRTKTGREYICETYDYMPAEDEIGYGTILTQFEQLDGDWVDDNEIKYWCYIEPFKE